jgi:predicted small lipoprotein YifL
VQRWPLLVVIAALAGCGQPQQPVASTAAPPREQPAAEKPKPRVRRAGCPASAENCAAATGRIVYLESLDADGDGDLHLVVAGGNVTGPGLSVFDISRELRPARDPRIGDLVSAAGPVYRGSYGQRQIQATVLHVRRR